MPDSVIESPPVDDAAHDELGPKGTLLAPASFWAPLSATLEGRKPPLLPKHLESSKHKEYEEAISLGRSLLVSRAAIELAGKLDERPTTSLSRFRAGLGITGRFCEPGDPERARRLE